MIKIVNLSPGFGTLVYNSSFAPFIFSKALIPEELIRIEGVNRDSYIIFFQVI